MLVIDTSVFIDYLFEKNEERNEKATVFLESIESLTVFVPMIFQIEVISVAKRLGVNISRKDVNKLVSDFELLN